MDYFGNLFATSEEQIEPLKGSIKGKIPDWLRGNLIRVGPGKFDFDDDFCCNHWFDGLAIMYSVSFSGNEIVTIRQRYLQSDAHKKSLITKRPIFSEFGTKGYPDTTKNFFSRMLSNMDVTLVTDNASINLIRIGREVFACSETCYIWRIDPCTLESLEKVDVARYLPIHCSTAHGLTNADGHFYNIATSFVPTPKYSLVKVEPTEEQRGKDVWLNAKVIGSIPSEWKTSYGYIHSFALTENYAIFLEQPLLVHTFRLATAQIKGRCLMDCMDWESDEPVKFHLINRHTGEAVHVKYMTDGFFTLHHINAYEIDNQLVLDVVTFEDIRVFKGAFLKELRKNERVKTHPHGRRFVLPLIKDINDTKIDEELVRFPCTSASAKRVQDSHKGDHIHLVSEAIGNQGFDMHTINPKFVGKEYNYLYAIGCVAAAGQSINGVFKINVNNGEVISWTGADSHCSSEPTFVPKPNAIDEDSGIIISAITEMKPSLPSYVIVLDAKNLDELARIEFGITIPYLLHGIFYSEEDIS